MSIEISHKYNNKENLSEFNVNKKASSLIQKELDKTKVPEALKTLKLAMKQCLNQ